MSRRIAPIDTRASLKGRMLVVSETYGWPNRLCDGLAARGWKSEIVDPSQVHTINGSHPSWCAVLLHGADCPPVSVIRDLSALGNRVIAITTRRAPDLAARALSSGAEACLEKTGNPEAIAEAVDTLARK